MKSTPFVLCILVMAGAALAETSVSMDRNSAFRDEQGRRFIPHGFAAITDDSMGEVRFTPEDYRKMTMGSPILREVTFPVGQCTK
ncbi:MAG: hypothetical protein WC334_05140 [Kiritimatiellales bacterium]|jgi:hypothetical protein